jgi:hypothetical protein
MVNIGHVFGKSETKVLGKIYCERVISANRFKISPVSVVAKYDSGALESSFSIDLNCFKAVGL